MTAMPHVPTAPAVAPIARVAIAVVPVLLTSYIGSISTTPNIEGWYAGLTKPSFNPPNWAFPVAWTILYAMIAYSGWRLLGVKPRTGPTVRAWWLAVAAFAAQLALNAAWSPVFFSAHALGAGVVVAAAMFVMILWTIRSSWRFDRIAAWLLVPYAAWVGFATILNAALWRLN